jgi:isoquinoline 1-oxidoreductase beta subunit
MTADRRSGPTPRTDGGGGRLLPSRRGFLIGTGAVLGVAVGFVLWPRQWPNAMAAAPDEVAMNAWLRIGPDGRVTVAVPQAEMGQGVMSGFAQIVADELGARWELMAVEPAPLHPAYAFTWLATEGTKGLPPVLRDIAAFAGARVIERLDLQFTGGSTSIRGYERTLREAAATARVALVRAAARQWQVDQAALDTADGAVFYKARQMPFAEAARLAAADDVPAEVPLRPLSTRRLYGKPLPRIDIPAKVNGTARYGADVRIPGMLFAAIRHGPAGSRLANASAPAGVRFVRGPHWVAALGPTSWEARRALDQVVAGFSGPAKPAGPWIEERLAAAARSTAGEEVARTGGDIPPPSAASIISDYAVPFLAHACMEPMVATARVSADRAELWGPTQSLTLARHAVATALDLDGDDVTIYPTLLGGGFGRKAEADAMVAAALVARAAGAPVQLLWSREEDLSAGVFRPAAAARLRAELGPGGRIATWEARIAVPSVGHGFLARNLPALARGPDAPNAAAIEGADRIPYATGAFRAVHVASEQPVPVGYWRSVGHSFSAFLVESFVDELAAKAGVDPLLYRRRLLVGNERLLAVLAAVADASDWDGPAAQGFARGVALHESFGSVVAMVVEAGIEDGRVRVRRVTSAIDCGGALNPDSVRGQVEGAALMGLAAAVHGRIDFAEGHAVQRNFDTYRIPTLGQSPDMTTLILDSGAPIGGVSEPGLPPAAPALANALAAATGRRCRTLPLAACYRS